MTPTRTSKRSANWVAELDGYLLMGIGAMLLLKARTGQLPLYVHPRYTTLIMVTGALLGLIGMVRAAQTGTQSQRLRDRAGMYGLLLVPLLLGMLLPAKPAGSALIDPSQLNNVGGTYGNVNTAPSDATPAEAENTDRWNLVDWMVARYHYKQEQLTGKPVDVVGFVYRAPNQSPNEFMVVRYTLSCCVADRRGLSLPVKWENAATLQDDQWVRVTGKIEARGSNGLPELGIVSAQVQRVDQPKNPYLDLGE